MNMLFIRHFVVVFMVSEIPRVSVFWHCPYSVTLPYLLVYLHTYTYIRICNIKCSIYIYIYIYIYIINYRIN